jgi:hypothetical protein
MAYKNAKYDFIQKGWNNVLSPNIKELEISDLDKEVLQAIVKFKQLLFFKGKNSGIPDTIGKQIGYIPSKEDLKQSMKTLQKLGYVQHLGQTVGEKGKVLIQFSVNEIKIKEDSLPPLSNELFPKL